MANDKSMGACLVCVDDLMQQAMFHLEHEFRSLMQQGADSFELNGNTELTRNLSFDSDYDNEENDDGIL
ncbi:hypothetical protein SLA2020_454690 [Shorea laevis]